MARSLTLESLGGSVALDGSTGVQGRAELRGTGMPPVSLQWFEGAGDGASFRSARVLPRTLDVPLKVTGANRSEVDANLSLVARILDPQNGPARLLVNLDGAAWYCNVYRSGGGDWTWGKDTDGNTVVLTAITLVAGDPYWEREAEEARTISPSGVGRGLLRGAGTLSGLEVSTTTGLGSVVLSNTGDVAAYPVWRITAPFTGFTLTSGSGEVLEWTGTKASGWIEVDTRAGTVVDELGVNQYALLAAAPRFWSVPPGDVEASVEVPDAVGGSTLISVFWRPRKWLVF